MEQRRQQQLFAALESSDAADALYQIALAWKAEGMSQQLMYDAFEACCKTLRSLDVEEQEDVVMDIMDRIVGWCAPQARIFGDTTVLG